MSVSQIHAANVAVMLGTTEMELKPTLQATTMILKHFGGLAKAREAVVQQDFEAITLILRWGLNLTDKDAKNLPKRIFDNGLTSELLVALIRYIAILANGGRPLDDDPNANVEGGEAAEGNE